MTETKYIQWLQSLSKGSYIRLNGRMINVAYLLKNTGILKYYFV